MKKVISTVLSAAITMGSVQFALADSTPTDMSKVSNGELIADSQAKLGQINDIKLQLESAKRTRKTALWVGIPLSVAGVLFGGLMGFAGGMSDAPSEGASFANKGLALMGVSALVAVGDLVFAHIKSGDIDTFQKNLDKTQALYNADIAALKDAK